MTLALLFILESFLFSRRSRSRSRSPYYRYWADGWTAVHRFRAHTIQQQPTYNMETWRNDCWLINQHTNLHLDVLWFWSCDTFSPFQTWIVLFTLEGHTAAFWERLWCLAPVASNTKGVYSHLATVTKSGISVCVLHGASPYTQAQHSDSCFSFKAELSKRRISKYFLNLETNFWSCAGFCGSGFSEANTTKMQKGHVPACPF